MLAALAFLGSCAGADRQGTDAPAVETDRYPNGQAYISAVRRKIRANLEIPAGVPDTATVTFVVFVSETGMISKMEQKRSSGSVAYESAVGKAILKSQPLPLLGVEGAAQRPLELRFRAKEW